MINDPVIVALDFDLAAAAGGMDYVRGLVDRGKRVFLDMKYYDIAETVKRAVAVAARSGAELLTVHGVGQVMRAAIDGRGDPL